MPQFSISSVLSGETITVDIENDATVTCENVKRLLEGKSGCNPDKLIIISSNKERELKNNENIDFTDTLEYLINEKKTFATKEELRKTTSYL